MNILIIGAGDVGFHLGRRLSQEKHNITIIDRNSLLVKRAAEQLDALVVEGHGASYGILRQAGVEDTDILAAMTNNDEVNLLACRIGKKAGVPITIARIRNHEITDPDFILSHQELGVDMFIHPEMETARAITRLLKQSEATDVIEFAGGKCQILGIRLEDDSPATGIPLKELARQHPHTPQRVVAVNRRQKTLIPGGDDSLQSGDQIFVVCRPDDIQQIMEMTGKSETKINDIMILGGGLIGQFIARALSREYHMKIIESNVARSQEIANILPNSLIIHGDGTDLDLLASEGLMEMDAFAAVTGDDETNIISTLVARHLKVPRTIALVNNVDYLPITPTIGMDAVVSKQLITVNAVRRFIRHKMVASIASLPEIDAEIIEFYASRESRITRKPLKHIRFPKSAIAGAILRGDQFLLPTGETQIQPGDTIVVFSLPEARQEVERLFQ